MPPKQHVRKQSGPPTRQPNVVGFNVGPAGAIAAVPTMFEARPNDIVVWVVGNTSGETIDVTIGTFLRKKVFGGDGKGDTEVFPFLWIGPSKPATDPAQSYGTLQLETNQTGMIAGLRNPDYDAGVLTDHVSYTITVTGDTFDIDYDPDGDIKP